MQLLCLGYPDRGSPGRKESGPTTAPIGGYAPGPISGPITDGEEEHPSSGTQNAESGSSAWAGVWNGVRCRSACSAHHSDHKGWTLAVAG